MNGWKEGRTESRGKRAEAVYIRAEKREGEKTKKTERLDRRDRR
jgi:hypothetical protein